MAMSPRQREEREEDLVSTMKMAKRMGSRQSRAFTLPDDAETFYIKEVGTFSIDIVAFKAGKGNKDADPGFKVAARDYWSHWGVGPNRETYQCLAGTWDEPCPICDHRVELEKDPNSTKEEKDSLKASRRLVCNLRFGKQDKVRVWDFSHWNFWRHLFAKVARRVADGKPQFQYWADPNKGMTLIVGAAKAAKGQGYECSDIEFEKREPLPDHLLKQAVCLDDCLLAAKIGYHELRSIFHQEPEPEPDDTEKEISVPSGKLNGQPYGDKDEAEEEKETNTTTKASEAKAGDTVYFRYKGKDWTGVVLSVDSKGEAKVQREGKPVATIDVEELDVAVLEPEEESEDEEETEEATATATAPGIKLNSWVMHDKHGLCEVIRIKDDGSLMIETYADTELISGIKPKEVKPLSSDAAEKLRNEMDEKGKESEEEEETPPAKPAPKPGKKPKKTS